jgi:aspartokinase
MTAGNRLNGSKVLKGVAAFTLLCPSPGEEMPLGLSRTFAEAGINLPYVTMTTDQGACAATLVVETADASRTERLLTGGELGELFHHNNACVVLSLFPHQSNPSVPAALFRAFEKEGLHMEGVANSPSAISLVMQESFLEPASRILFEAFTFKTYRTPEEWKTAQQGKEVLYKEVVASYQEKRPKVYGVTCLENQRLVSHVLEDGSLAPVAEILEKAADLGQRLSLITFGPSRTSGREHVLYGLPAPVVGSTEPSDDSYVSIPSTATETPAAVFTMNGPHFGDRYGITSELLTALDGNGVHLLALNCTVASITGAIPASELDAALDAIQNCFEVPSVFRA